MKTRYTCPLCDNAVTLHVNPSQPPTCYNPNKHTGKRIDMIAENRMPATGEKGKHPAAGHPADQQHIR